METLQNNNVWEYFATVEALMKSHQLSLILDVVNPFISILSAELMQVYKKLYGSDMGHLLEATHK